LHLVGDLFLLGRELLGGAHRVLQIALAALRLALIELLQRLAQPLFGGGGLRAAVARLVGGGAAHRIGRFAQAPRGAAQLLAGLLPRELLEPARGLLGLVGQRALRARPAAAAGLILIRRHPALPFGLGLLPARELLQLLRELVDLPVGG